MCIGYLWEELLSITFIIGDLFFLVCTKTFNHFSYATALISVDHNCSTLGMLYAYFFSPSASKIVPVPDV